MITEKGEKGTGTKQYHESKRSKIYIITQIIALQVIHFVFEITFFQVFLGFFWYKSDQKNKISLH